MGKKIRDIPVLGWIANGTFTGTGTLLSMVFVVGVIVVMFFSHASVTLTETSVKASATAVSSMEVRFEDIDSVELRSLEGFEIGERSRGFSNFFMVGGSYFNDELELYDLYLFKSNKENYVLIQYSKVGLLAVNQATPEETEELYRQLSEAIK